MAEAETFERVNRGEPLPVDEHFDRRLEPLLDDAEKSGDYIDVNKHEFEAMEREALNFLRERKSS